jgi:hypothetical protein
MLRYGLRGVASAALLISAHSLVEAAPAPAADAMRSALGEAVVLQKAAYRCWWRGGVRRCSWSGARVYGYYTSPGVYGYYRRPSSYGYLYGRPRPEFYPTGSTAWWRAMDYEGRGGHGRGP